MLAAVTLFASCSQEEIVSQTGGESLVSFTVTTPELGSRAVGDGTTAKNLYYAVYDETSGQSVMVETISKNGTEGVENDVLTMPENKKTTINLPLLNGHKYSLLFWAESAEGAYKIDFAKKSISLKNAAALVSNNENYDAFYAYVEPFVVTGEKNESVLLYRPFAQLNIGTTQSDIARVGEYFGSALIATKIVVKGVPTSMDLATGKVSDTKADLTYGETAFSGIQGETFPVVGGYQYISMNYILVGKSEKSLVDVELTTDVQGLEVRKYHNVPLQGNYRTNIYGELFTSNSTWNVEIENEFETPAYEVLDGVLELEGDLTINESFRVENSLAINLNGHKLSYEGNDILIRVDNGAKLTLNGPGEIVSTDYIASVNAGGEIYVNGGSYTGSTTCFNVNGGNLYITGGYFNAWNETYEGVYTLNHKDGTGGKIEVTGGGFYKYDPSNSSSENPGTSFVAEGYAVTSIGEVYYVAKAGATVATSAENLTTALTAAGEVAMVKDVTTSTTFNAAAGVNIDGQGNTLFMNNIAETGKLALGLTVAGGEVKNLTIDGQNQGSVNNYGYRAIYIVNPQEDVVIDNVTIKGVLYPINTGTMNTAKEGVKLSVSNSTLEGWTSFAGLASAKFERCHFGIGTYYGGDTFFDALVKPYVDTVFENCNFDKGYYIDLSAFNGEKVIFKNCTVAGVKLTSDMFANVAGVADVKPSTIPQGKSLWYEEGDNAKFANIVIE